MEIKSKGAALIAVERERQVLHLGYDAQRDEAYTGGQLGLAGIYYAAQAMHRYFPDEDCEVKARVYPWAGAPQRANAVEVRLDQLVKAGALIAAEIDRMLRDDREAA